MFEIIPVIDLQQGQVVHAKRGMRDQYQPLQTSLVQHPNLENLCRYFCKHTGLHKVYIADLDALSDRGDQFTMIRQLLKTIADIDIWLDAGRKFIDLTEHYYPVVGTETDLSPNQLVSLKQQHPRLILSLDFTNDGLMGNKEILQYPELWPQNIILMNLDRVGSRAGIDKLRVEQIQSMTESSQRLYVAGGVHNQTDLKLLEDMGIHGALIASAIHTQSIQLEQYRQDN